MVRDSSSGSEEEKKIDTTSTVRRGSVVESLHELPDPDAGKTPEERAKIVRQLHFLCLLTNFLCRTGR